MKLIIDLGNTFCKFYYFKGDEVVLHGVVDNKNLTRIPLNVSSGDQHFVASTVILSTVIRLSRAEERWFASIPCPHYRFDATTPIPIQNKYRTPKTLGADRLAAAIGAWSLRKGVPLLIIDAGTCFTCDLVSAEGEFLGGSITLGLPARFKALHAVIPTLPLVNPAGDIPAVGYDTETSIRAGITHGMEFEVTSLVNKYLDEYPDLHIFITGGDAEMFALQSPKITVDKMLVARGLNVVLDNILSSQSHE